MLFDKDKIQKITLFENLTNSKIKDLLEDEKITIIVQQGEIGKAIGKQGKNIKMIENMMRKRLKIIEFNNNPLEFVANFIYPVKAENISLNDRIIEIKPNDKKSKGLLIGRERKNLNELNNLVKSYFSLTIKIL